MKLAKFCALNMYWLMLPELCFTVVLCWPAPSNVKCHPPEYFPNDEAAYTSTVRALPNGKSFYYVCYGDGTNFGSGSGGTNEALGVRVALPSEPIDGCRVVLYSSLHRNSTMANQVMRINFPGPLSGDIPGTRRIIANGISTAASVSGGINLVCPASTAHTRNHTYIYSSTDDFWTQIVDSS